MGHAFAKIAVERGIDQYPEGLTYSIPAGVPIELGDAVQVPLGRGTRLVSGWVIAVGGSELCGNIAPARIKAIAERAGHQLPDELLSLAKWIAAYYCCPIGMTLAALLPSAVRKRVGMTKRVMVSKASVVPDRLNSRQQAVLAALESGPQEQELGALAQAAAHQTTATIKRMITSGMLISRAMPVIEARWLQAARLVPEARIPVPTDEQRQAIESLERAVGNGFSQHLLFGVTGSGKTEVYLSVIERVLRSGKSAIYLVPEIALTPQTTARLLARLRDHPVLLLHSGLTSAQRHEQWIRASQPGPKVVLGARSAIFAPLPDGELGLVVVDEEHDHSYKQDSAPRYNGRDAAIRRAQLAGCAVLMGSATPSLETWHNAVSRDLATIHRLTRRAPGLSVPQVQIVDFRSEMAGWEDRRIHQIGPTLQGHLRKTVDSGKQAILLLNRRGYANFVGCLDRKCGWVLECDFCSARMVVHKGEAQLRGLQFVRCHHCGSEQRLPRQCPQCAKRLSVFGLGTQRIEEELRFLLPDLPQEAIARIDSDSASTAADFHRLLGEFASGSIRVLLGTQMIAKGLDFPGVALVGVISADTAINLPDFRASERTFQLVSQVAGRCGRGSNGGVAIVQSFHPDAAAITMAAAHDFERFARDELDGRRKFGLPPVTRMARIIVKARLANDARDTAEAIAQGLRKMPESKPITIDGPAPCPMERIADRWRYQVELRAGTASILSVLLSEARSQQVVQLGEGVAVDVDPINLL